jgi:hypothetical protein
MHSTPVGISIFTGPLINKTLAPYSAKTRAIAYPIFPELLLLTKRTGSIASRVGPAVTRTRLSFKILFFLELVSIDSVLRTYSIISSGSAILP